MLKHILLILYTILFITFAHAQDNVWQVMDYEDTDTVTISVNGQITHGDRLYIMLPKDECGTGVLITTVASFQEIEQTMPLKNTWIPASFMGHDIQVRVVNSEKIFIGSLTTIHIRALPTPTLYQALMAENPITLLFKDSDTFTATDYFDRPQNAWNTQGLDEALEKAMEMCMKL